MDSLLTLNVVGYAAALGGGVVVGTLFGRSIVSDLGGIVHSLEARVITLETALHLSERNRGQTTPDPIAAGAQSNRTRKRLRNWRRRFRLMPRPRPPQLKRAPRSSLRATERRATGGLSSMPLIGILLSQYWKPLALAAVIAARARVSRAPRSSARDGARQEVGQVTAEANAALRTTNQALGAMIDRQNAAVAELKARADAVTNAMAVELKMLLRRQALRRKDRPKRKAGR